MGSRLDTKSNLVRKRIEGHHFDHEEGEEYEGSKFGGFSEYFRRKKIKLQNLDVELRSQSTDKPQIFRGIVCHVNGYTQPSLNDLHVMIVQHGGGFIQYLDGKTMVTHIIASNLTPKKKEEFRRYRIVKPAWIVDSVTVGKLLPWHNYRVLDEGVGQKVLGFEKGSIVSQANPRIQGYREQTNTSWYTHQLEVSSPQTNQLNHPAEVVAPYEEALNDEEYSLPDITSSMEEALCQADQIQPLEPAQNMATRNSQAGKPECTTQTPPVMGSPLPPPSPPLQPSNAHSAMDGESYSAAQAEQMVPKHIPPWQAFDETEYSHAVVAKSDVFKNVPPAELASMTAEEHNALLLSDPTIRKSTVVHPDFLDQYYRESRLHHLSTWKAELKAKLQAVAAEKTTSQKSKLKRASGQRRYVMHVDFDSFFAAVSLKKYPQYMDKPAVVAHGMGSGSEIASCNYPARKFGISNGMWMKRALQLCPDVKILPYDFPGYEAASREFYGAVIATGGIVQSVSIDEALVDISTLCFAEAGTDGVNRDEGGVHREQDTADLLARKVRDQVLEKTGCAVSIGIGGNILQAKLALRKAKPEGQYQLKPKDLWEFIGQLEVTRLPGVAWSTGGKLEDIGIRLVKDMREVTKEKLMATLGPKTGEKLWEYARGIDRTEVGEQVVRKSVSAEVNWGVRFENQEQVDEFMHGLCGELHKRLLKENVKGKQLTMKVMKRAANAPLDPPKHLGHGRCDVFNKSLRLGVATNDQIKLAKEAISMMKSFAISPGELRGIGVQMQQLEPLKPGSDGVDQASQRQLPYSRSVKTLSEHTPTGELHDPIQDASHSYEIDGDSTLPNTTLKPVPLGTSLQKPLNVLGTQFILPSQVDPDVLAQLPYDIRAKLAKHTNKQADGKTIHCVANRNDLDESSRAQSPAVTLPPQSQIDPTILEALPTDVRNEILGLYKSPGHRAEKRGDQTILPQSPRKIRALPPTREASVKRTRGRPRGSRNLVSRVNRNSARAETSTLTQSNFITHTGHQDDTTTNDTESESEELDPDVLAALPEDLRKEILAQHRQARLQRTGGIDLSLHQRPQNSRKRRADEESPLDRLFTLPSHSATPTFTARKLSGLAELRNAVSAWFKEFSDEGPYDDDVAALTAYLRDVVVEEHDSSKAAAVVRWIAWTIGAANETPEHVVHAWQKALGKIQEAVEDAADERGLGRIVFG